MSEFRSSLAVGFASLVVGWAARTVADDLIAARADKMIADKFDKEDISRKFQLWLWDNISVQPQPWPSYTTRSLFYDIRDWARSNSTSVAGATGASSQHFLPLQCLNTRISSGYIPIEILDQALSIARTSSELLWDLQQGQADSVLLDLLGDEADSVAKTTIRLKR